MPEYIIRGAAIKEMSHMMSECFPEAVEELDAVITTVKEIPAADVVEVVHASWVWNPDGMDWGIGAWVCGKCKSRPETWWNTVKECHPLRCSGSRYCGNCGAKMDGGQDDGI